MSNNRPFCVASNGDRFYLVALQPLNSNNEPSGSILPLLPYQNRIIILQSQLHPFSLQSITWTTLDTHPAGILEGELVKDKNNCQIDSGGTFIWISAIKSSPVEITTGVQYNIMTGKWATIKSSRLPGHLGSNYIWNDGVGINSLFSIAQGIFVHATASAPGINLGLFKDGNLVQSNSTWTLDEASGVPKTISFANNMLYVLGSNKILSTIPVNPSVKDVDLLNTNQQSLGSTDIKTIALPGFPDDCLDQKVSNLYSSAVGNTVYYLCTSINSNIARLFSMKESSLSDPYIIPTSNQAKITSFSAISVPQTPLGSADILIFSLSDDLVGMSVGTGGLFTGLEKLSVKGVDGTTSSGPQTSPSPTPTDSTSSSSGSNNSGGIGGGITALIVVLVILYCRFIRPKRRKEKIDRIMRENDGITPQIVSPDDPPTIIVLPQPPLPPSSSQSPLTNFNPITDEQFDQEQIQMQRIILGPTPSISASASPIAPPSAVAQIGDIPMALQSQYANSTMEVASAPALSPYHHALYTHQPTQHLYQGIEEPHESSDSKQLYSDPYSGSSTTNLISKSPIESEQYKSVVESQSGHMYVEASSSSCASHPHPADDKKSWAHDKSEDQYHPPPPPPPPYIAKVTELLNVASAPMPDNQQ